MQAERGIVMYMKDWVEKLNAFLKFNEREILEGNGKVTAEVAKVMAEAEFEKYRVIQDREYVSDFDLMVEKLVEEKKGDGKKNFIDSIGERLFSLKA